MNSLQMTILSIWAYYWAEHIEAAASKQGNGLKQVKTKYEIPVDGAGYQAQPWLSQFPATFWSAQVLL